MAFKIKYSHRFIIIWLSLAAFLHNILMNGANNVILSSLQKEFYLSSRETGIYVSVYDIGSLISTVFVSFAAAKGSKPRWIAFGLTCLFIGCMIDIVPHFIRPDPNEPIDEAADKSGSNFSIKENSIELCNLSIGYTNDDQQFRQMRNLDTQLNTKEVIKSSNFFQLKHLLYLGNTINGFSSASMTTITFAYIEDVAPPHLSAIYESIYYAVGAFGVGVGFIITSKFLTIHTDINKAIKLPTWLKPSHPNWIGAWWLPFLLFGFISLILALVIFTFPRKQIHMIKSKSNSSIQKKESKKLKKNGVKHKNGNLKHENELVCLNTEEANEVAIQIPNADTTEDSLGKLNTNTNELLNALENTGSLLSLNKLGAKSSRIDLTNLNDEEDSQATASNLESVKINKENDYNSKDLFTKSISLLKKPVYVLIIIATTIEGLLQNSFLAFAALFLEYQYRLASGTASFVLALLSIPPLMIGGILSGIIVKRLKYRINDCLKFLAIVLLINVIVYSGFMVYCKEPNMIPTSEQMLRTGMTKTQDFSNSISYKIAENCNCNRKIFKPVCLKNSEDIFFQSACLAGCTDINGKTDQFIKCSQENDSFVKVDSIVEGQDEYLNYFVSGLCPTSNCDLKLIISYACIFFLMLLNALTFLPYLKVTIGSIDSKEMNPIGLGMKQFFMNGLGTIPGPILFGSVIDSTCTYWHTDQKDQRVCKIYNNQQFAFGFGLLGVGFKTICLILVILSMFILKRQKNRGTN